MQLMTDWLPEQPLERLEIIREFLLFVYSDRIRRKLVPTRADFLSVQDELRDQIVQHFLARTAKRDIPLEEFWHDIMGFWSQVPQTATDVVLLTYVARFDYLINTEPQTQVAETNVRKRAGRRDNPTSLGPRSRFRRAEQPSASAAAATDRREFLTDEQVRKLIDGSSVLRQAFGKLLNMRMTLNFSRLGIDQQPRGARLLGETIGDLRMRLKTLGNDHFHWLYVHEYDAEAGHSCQFVAYIPEPYEAAVEAYLRERIGYKARGSVPDDALLLEMPSAIAPSSHIGGRAAGRPQRGPTRRKQALGAGWGRWLSAGAFAARQLGRDYRLFGVEAEPTHFNWMLRHLAENGLVRGRYTVIRAAASDREGACWFRIGNAANWYGQSIVPDAEVGPELNADAQLWSDVTIGDASLQRVHSVDLRAVVRDLPVVDYMHMDIQGAEADFLEAYPDILRHRVRAVNIGTHSSEVEERLRALFFRLRWRCVYDVRLSKAMVKVGSGDAKRIEFGDGVQVWTNPRLLPAGSP
jgi:FkbM family methyltransferase